MKDQEGNVWFFLTKTFGDNGSKLERHDFESYYNYDPESWNKPCEYVSIQKDWIGCSTYFDRDLKFKINVSYTRPGNTEERIIDVESSVNEPATIKLPIGSRLTVWEERCPDGYNYEGGSAYNYNRELEEYKDKTVGYVFPEQDYNIIKINNRYKEVCSDPLKLDLMA